MSGGSIHKHSLCMVIRNRRLSSVPPDVPMARMTRDSSFDVAVIGGGVMGLATVRKLAERKARVVLFGARRSATRKRARTGGR